MAHKSDLSDKSDLCAFRRIYTKGLNFKSSIEKGVRFTKEKNTILKSIFCNVEAFQFREKRILPQQMSK